MGRFGRATKKKIKKADPPGVIAVPVAEWQWTPAVHARAKLEFPPGSTVATISGGGGPAFKRNQAIQTVLDDARMKWCFFLDADQTPEAKTLLRLLDLNVPIASALYYCRVPPFQPVCGLLPGLVEADLTSGPFEDAWTGGGALLVRREVLEALAPGPYFEYHDGQAIGEDINFCKRARKAGFPILIDPDINVGHVAVVPVDRQLATAWQEVDGILDVQELTAIG